MVALLQLKQPLRARFVRNLTSSWPRADSPPTKQLHKPSAEPAQSIPLQLENHPQLIWPGVNLIAAGDIGQMGCVVCSENSGTGRRHAGAVATRKAQRSEFRRSCKGRAIANIGDVLLTD